MQDAEEVSRNAEKRRKARQRRLDMEDKMREDRLLLQLGDDDAEWGEYEGDIMDLDFSRDCGDGRGARGRVVKGLGTESPLDRRILPLGGLAKGKKQAVWQPSRDPVIGIDGHSGATEGEDDNDEADEDSNNDERGDIESNEELLMGGEGWEMGGKTAWAAGSAAAALRNHWRCCTTVMRAGRCHATVTCAGQYRAECAGLATSGAVRPSRKWGGLGRLRQLLWHVGRHWMDCAGRR
ncbi:hypothetical protein B0H14DRAFT_2636735 [Mycena olivaceomarginata]|nr:hypothetical protein B0H14DRAFT_2636735 [Mycena olivaceomarginata]